MLAGGGPVVSTQSGVVSLNLHTLVSQLAATVGLSSQAAAVQSKLQGSTGATVRAVAQQKLGDHAAARQRPAGDHALERAQDRAGHRQRCQEPRDRAAGARDPAVRAGGVPRARTAPADAANDRLVLRADRSGAVADPQSRRRRGRQRPGQDPVEQTGGASGVEHRHLAAARHRCRDDRLRDRDRRLRVARRPDPPGDRDTKGPGSDVARQSRGRLLHRRRRAAAARADRSNTGIPEYRLDPAVRRAARVRRHDAPTPDRTRVRGNPARPSAARLPRPASQAHARKAAPAAPPAHRRDDRLHPRRSPPRLPRPAGMSRRSSDSRRSEPAARSPTRSSQPRRHTS